MSAVGSSRSVIIDDTSSSITYSPGWRLRTFSISNLQATGSPIPPRYGTLHVNEFDASSANFTFAFTGECSPVKHISLIILHIGVGISAFFTNTNIGAIDSCILDGQPMTISPGDDPQTVQCTINQTSPQVHEFMVISAAGWAESVSFDYLAYSPGEENISATDLDLAYSVPMLMSEANSQIKTSTGVPQLTSLGDSLDFTFVGERTVK